MFGFLTRRRTPPTYFVRIGNRAAVQDLHEASGRVDDAIESYPWDENLREIKSLLEDVWNGLTFEKG